MRGGQRSHLWQDEALGGVEAARILDWRQSYVPHTHDELMIGLPRSGVLGFARERRVFHSGPRAIAVVNPGDLHTGFPGAGASVSYDALYVPAPIIRTCAPAPGSADGIAGFSHGVVADDPGTFDLLAGAYRSIAARVPRLAREARLHAALRQLYARHARPRPTPAAGAPSGFARIAGEVIEANLDGELSIAALAAAVGVSPSHLMRRFRREMGAPVHAYLTQRRLARAKSMLLAGTAPAEVAATLGFADQAHLTRRFKQFTGVTPAAMTRLA